MKVNWNAMILMMLINNYHGINNNYWNCVSISHIHIGGGTHRALGLKPPPPSPQYLGPAINSPTRAGLKTDHYAC